MNAPVIVFLMSLPGVVVSFLLSMLLHPRFYSPDASRFSHLRGGPAMGIFLIGANYLVKRSYLRQHEAAGTPVARSLMDAWAFLWAAIEVAAGVFVADMTRGFNQVE